MTVPPRRSPPVLARIWHGMGRRGSARLVSTDDEVGALPGVLRGDIGVFFGHPDLCPLGSPRSAISLDASREPDRARRVYPYRQVPAVAQFCSGGGHALDDDHAAGGDIVPLGAGVCWPVPTLVAGGAPGQQRIEHLAAKAVLVPSWYPGTREVVQADDMGIGEPAGNTGREGAAPRAVGRA
jgi:hypothetical protein